MNELIKGQFHLWLDADTAGEPEELRLAYRKFDELTCRLPDYLKIESAVNEYQYLTAERAFCAGFSWAVSLAQQALAFAQTE